MSIRLALDTGMIELDMPVGRHRLELRFGDTPVRALATSLTVVGLLATIMGGAQVSDDSILLPIPPAAQR